MSLYHIIDSEHARGTHCVHLQAECIANRKSSILLSPQPSIRTNIVFVLHLSVQEHTVRRTCMYVCMYVCMYACMHYAYVSMSVSARSISMYCVLQLYVQCI